MNLYFDWFQSTCKRKLCAGTDQSFVIRESEEVFHIAVRFRLMVISLYRDLDNLAWETPIFLLSRFNFKLFSISLSDPMLDKWAIFV